MEKEKVKVHGFWASPYVRMVKIGLNIKAIPFKYVEEGMMEETQQMLLQYNPVHKKVPVLLHDGVPISESLVILQYIDETWRDHHPLLFPTHPLSRSKVFFWALFIYNQIYYPLNNYIRSPAKGENKTILEVRKSLKDLEENMKVIFASDAPSSEQEMGILDVILSIMPSYLNGVEEAFDLKLIDPQIHTLICSRTTSLAKFTAVKETTPYHKRLVKFYRLLKHISSVKSSL